MLKNEYLFAKSASIQPTTSLPKFLEKLRMQWLLFQVLVKAFEPMPEIDIKVFFDVCIALRYDNCQRVLWDNFAGVTEGNEDEAPTDEVTESDSLQMLADRGSTYVAIVRHRPSWVGCNPLKTHQIRSISGNISLLFRTVL